MDKQLKDIQNATFSILKDFINCCEANDLKYYLFAGTLLGAARHQGFIPWDDDIDVAMPRRDYEKFLENFEELMPKHLGLITPENTEHYDVFFSKIHDTRTTYVQKGMNIYPDRHTGVFIDVFPLDGFPSDRVEQEQYIKKYELYRKMNYKMRFTVKGNPSLRGKILQIVLSPLKLCLQKDYFYIKYKTLACSYKASNCDYIIYPTVIDLHRCILKKAMFGNGGYLTFNGTKAAVPEYYDAILQTIYRNYMKLPPIAEQVPHHDFDYFDSELPCKEYAKSKKK